MKRLLSVLMLSSISFFGCTSCEHPIIPSAGDAALDSKYTSTTTLISTSDWEFTLPVGWSVKTNDAGDDKFIAVDQTGEQILVFGKEAFVGTYESYTLTAIREFRAAGAKSISAGQVKINGLNFVRVESLKGDIRMWAWLTFKDGMGYGFYCGGTDNDAGYDDCNSIMDSLKIK